MMTKFRWSVSILMAMGMAAMSPAVAVELNVTAEFRPNALNPMHREFRNTTPPSGLCVTWASYYNCEANRVFSLALPIDVRFRDIPADGADRDSFSLKIPSEPRSVRVSNGADEVELFVRIGMLAADAVFPEDVRVLVGADPAGSAYQAHYALWDGAYGLFWAPPPCQHRGPLLGSAFSALFIWEFPPNAVCVKHARYPIPGDLSISRGLSFSYELITPDPMAMPSGEYVGRLELSVGPGADFDFGDRAIVSDSLVAINFNLTVLHDFQVRFATDTPRVELTPVGGWPAWVDSGLLPKAMQADLPFYLTSTTEFDVRLSCEFHVGDRCGIRDPQLNAVVTVDVEVTMPGMRDIRNGRPVQDSLLTADDARAPRFSPDGYLIDRRSRLRFIAHREAVAEMFKSPGSRWEGNMTVVFDASP